MIDRDTQVARAGGWKFPISQIAGNLKSIACKVKSFCKNFPPRLNTCDILANLKAFYWLIIKNLVSICLGALQLRKVKSWRHFKKHER